MRRTWLIVTMLALAMVATPSCSRLRRHLSGATPTRSGTVVVAPPSGPTGTKFSLTGTGFRPGEPMTFEIDSPNHSRFVGQTHIAGPDGKVSGSYTPQAGDPLGTYLIKAVGSRGTRANGRVILATGPTPTT